MGRGASRAGFCAMFQVPRQPGSLGATYASRFAQRLRWTRRQAAGMEKCIEDFARDSGGPVMIAPPTRDSDHWRRGGREVWPGIVSRGKDDLQICQYAMGPARPGSPGCACVTCGPTPVLAFNGHVQIRVISSGLHTDASDTGANFRDFDICKKHLDGSLH